MKKHEELNRLRAVIGVCMKSLGFQMSETLERRVQSAISKKNSAVIKVVREEVEREAKDFLDRSPASFAVSSADLAGRLDTDLAARVRRALEEYTSRIRLLDDVEEGFSLFQKLEEYLKLIEVNQRKRVLLRQGQASERSERIINYIRNGQFISEPQRARSAYVN